MSGWLVDAGGESARALLRLMADGVIERSAEIALRSFARTLNRVRRGKALVGIVGIGGAGKSSLARVISGKLALHQLPMEYDSDLSEQTTEFKNLDYLQVLTIAGQETLASRGHAKIAREIASLRRLVLINVVGYGYSAPPRTITRPQFEAYLNMPGAFPELVSTYFVRQRVEEQMHLARLAKTFESMKSSSSKPWAARFGFVTLILKQDLWWDEQDDVHRHYSGGEYSRALSTLESVLGGFEFNDLLSTSLQPLNVQLSDGAILRQVCQGYDRRALELNWLNTVRRLEEIKMWAAKG